MLTELPGVLRVLILCGTVLAANSGGSRQGAARDVLYGIVKDSAGETVPYVNVRIGDGSRRVLSDDSGVFLARRVSMPVRLQIRRIGFLPLDTTIASLPDTFRVTLSRVTANLDRVTVYAPLTPRSLEIHGFYQRLRDAERGINRGYFVTPEDIERTKPPYTTRLVTGFPSVRVVQRGFPMNDAILGTNGCRMTVYMDRIRIVGTLSGKDERVNEMVAPTHVAGIEVYPNAVSAPPEFQALNGNCGVVLIWTK